VVATIAKIPIDARTAITILRRDHPRFVKPEVSTTCKRYDAGLTGWRVDRRFRRPG
jgi:hypothetical protein